MNKSSRKVQYWVAFAVALAAMTSSVSFSWTTPVIPKFHNNETALTVTDAEIAWIVVLTSPGMIVGTIASRFQSDSFGRRSVLLTSAVPFCVGTTFMLLTTKVWIIYIARFLWGVGAGMVQTVSMIYLAEIASKEIRGSLVVLNRFLFNFGGFMVITVGSFVSYHTLSYMLIVLPATYFCACWWISESPYYLLKEDKVDAARKELMKLNGYEDNQILEEKLTEMRKHVKEDMRRSTTARELFTGKRCESVPNNVRLDPDSTIYGQNNARNRIFVIYFYSNDSIRWSEICCQYVIIDSSRQSRPPPSSHILLHWCIFIVYCHRNLLLHSRCYGHQKPRHLTRQYYLLFSDIILHNFYHGFQYYCICNSSRDFPLKCQIHRDDFNESVW